MDWFKLFNYFTLVHGHCQYMANMDFDNAMPLQTHIVSVLETMTSEENAYITELYRKILMIDGLNSVECAQMAMDDIRPKYYAQENIKPKKEIKVEIPVHKYVPKHEPDPAIDWNVFQKMFESHYGYKMRDFHVTHGYDGELKNAENECSYLDFWHWLLDHGWEEVSSDGSYVSLYRDPEELWLDEIELEDLANGEGHWAMKIINDIFAFVPKDHPAYNASDDSINFYVWW